MPKRSKRPRIVEVTLDYRQRLLDNEASALTTLDNAYSAIVDSINPHLQQLYRQIYTAIKNDTPLSLSWLYETGRLEALTNFIQGRIDHYSALAQTNVANLTSMAVGLGNTAAMEQLQATIPKNINFSFGIPSPQAIQNLIGANEKGSPLRDLFRSFGKQAANDVKDALVTGIATGMGPRQIAPMVQNALDIPRWRALTISRTETLRAYRSAQLENFRANDDVVDGWIWICSLSVNSCAACIAMHGSFHTLDETLDEHPNGACSQAPHTKDWSDILGPLGIDTSDLEDTSASIESGSDWFDNQSADFQQQVLGAKYDDWANGNFRLSDVVGYNHSSDWGRSIYEKPLKALS